MGISSIKWIVVALVILGIVFFFYLSRSLHRQYRLELREGLERTENITAAVVTMQDIAHLPEPVQRYLKYVGVVGKERVHGFKVAIDGSMRTDPKRDWAKVQVEQYSFTDQITRLFFLKMNMSGIPVIGLHEYKNGEAVMDIRLAGLIQVINGRGPQMNQGETVTVFNDMCIMAPATLIDERIQWESIDTLTARGVFTNEGITVSAILQFNEDGQLINFVSDDRYYSPTGKTYEKVTWSTPVSNYRNINGFNLATYGEAVWSFPDRDYSYARFNIRDIVYNPSGVEGKSGT